MKRILIVDDDETFRYILAELLRKEFEVLESSGVKDALTKVKMNSVDLILNIGIITEIINIAGRLVCGVTLWAWNGAKPLSMSFVRQNSYKKNTSDSDFIEF